MNITFFDPIPIRFEQNFKVTSSLLSSEKDMLSNKVFKAAVIVLSLGILVAGAFVVDFSRNLYMHGSFLAPKQLSIKDKIVKVVNFHSFCFKKIILIN